ncbi:MAG: hypothetical protein JNN07_05470 [Verrucomicrobiales bacterium]|nr:hypothetical protein [Verrucomicrobiales bacterium]
MTNLAMVPVAIQGGYGGLGRPDHPARKCSFRAEEAEVPCVSDHRILGRIGQGGGGTVWLARTVLGSYRAVKVVTRAWFARQRHYELEFEGLKSFEAVCRKHPDFLQIFHVGRSERDECFYYSMELADPIGLAAQQSPVEYRPRTLGSLLEPAVPMPVGLCLDLFLKLTKLLALLHAEGLIHRDLKPSNVLFVDGRLKLADVGLVTSARAATAVGGTPGYAPPEGADSVAGDLYSLGRMLYQFLNGCSCQRFPEIPADGVGLGQPLYWDLNEVMLHACHPDPTRRYRSAVEMHGALRRLISNQGNVPVRPWWSFFLPPRRSTPMTPSSSP